MSDKLTRKEHHARAMLMGRKYDPRDGSYCVPSFDGDFNVSEPYLDCVTLEVITHADAQLRMQRYGGATDKPLTTTYPWEAFDAEDDA